MYDFVALKTQIFTENGGNVDVVNQQVIEMRSRIVQIIVQLGGDANGVPAPRFILNVLCTALAYFTIHTHLEWPSLIEDLTQAFSSNIDQAICLLSTLKYMANDCDNDSIVIEDSTRSKYF